MKITQPKGDLALSRAIYKFTEAGYDVFLPLTESGSYDMIVDGHEGVKRVQVKYTSRLEVDLRQVHTNSKGYVVKKYDASSYDWLYAFRGDTQEDFIYRDCLAGRCSISVNKMERWQSLADCTCLENRSV